jgi:hypothetical protein
MSLNEIAIEGTIQPDGTLVLDEPTKLPAGRVKVIVQSLPELPDGDPFWDMMKSIWSAQEARGHVARSVAEVEGFQQRARPVERRWSD